MIPDPPLGPAGFCLGFFPQAGAAHPADSVSCSRSSPRMLATPQWAGVNLMVAPLSRVWILLQASKAAVANPCPGPSSPLADRLMTSSPRQLCSAVPTHCAFRKLGDRGSSILKAPFLEPMWGRSPV